ncbi:MAG: M28 family peptidase [Acidobacteria bacterium]|nr:M28 family peptidase [Acidobacteriota bacterium]MBV9476381.1 M28 family peptidase [Acidobacteriota bacterium]
MSSAGKLALAFACSVVLAAAPQPPIERHIRTLAADDMEGRGLGTQGIGKAASYIETQLRDARLRPAFGSSYRQKFPVKMGVALGAKNAIEGLSADDWTPLAFSSAGSFAGPIAFVGYGIDAPPLGYLDYEGIDLKGKVALMLRYEPQERDDNSVFDGRKPSRWSALRYKAMQARERGAVAVVFVTGPQQDEDKDKLPALVNDGPESAAGIPVLQVKTSVAQQWVDLAGFQKAVDADLKPRSRILDRTLKGNVDVAASYVDAENVAGLLAGRGKLADEVVVLGAHYDHLGYGGKGSLKPNEHAIHNGADDNASGTAAVLVAAQRLGELLKDARDRRTILFALFSAEEVGLGGSAYLVDHPPVPLDKIVAMVNLDMVGALRDDKLVAFGTDSAPEWKALVDRVGADAKLAMTESGDGYGPSDQTSFYAKRIPVLHYFTGTHDRYHTPEDDADAINFAGAARVAEVTAQTVASIARGDVTPHYARVASAPAMEGDSRGYGAYLGTIPDYSAMDATEGGVKLADVRAGGPADLAGIKGGDVLVEMAGTRIANLYDMTYALQDHKPGETIDVVVVRNGARVPLRATLGSRGAQPAPGSGAHGVMPLEIKAGKPFDKTFDGEKHLTDVRQLTFGGENAEAYFSPDGRKIIYQSTSERGGCDQEYEMDLATGETKLVSSGKGRTTCGYFSYPNGDRIIYASTEAADPGCPPPPDRSRGYIWGVYKGYDLYIANADGSNKKRISLTPGYDAEATWCHKGGRIIFTSVRDGDLDLYSMNEDGSDVKRLTNTVGYDGGAFYNAQCTEIVWRASRFTDPAALAEYQSLLADGFVKPSKMELYVANADGSNARQLTANGAANFCPWFMPDQKRIIFSSNVLDPRGREFDLFIVNKDGSGTPERVTTAPAFDGFPIFSPDGKYIVWGSNRANPEGHDTNLFIARWVE